MAHEIVVSRADGLLPFTVEGGAVTMLRDEFLSEEDLDLRHLTDEELDAYWSLWLEQAQFTNDSDEFEYSHGVFESFGRPKVPTKSSPLR